MYPNSSRYNPQSAKKHLARANLGLENIALEDSTGAITRLGLQRILRDGRATGFQMIQAALRHYMDAVGFAHMSIGGLRDAFDQVVGHDE